MTTTNKLRIATMDAADAADLACSEVESAVGLPVRAELQEVEGRSLILELRLGPLGVDKFAGALSDGAVHTRNPIRLAMVVENASPNVEVLSEWNESAASIRPSTRYCHHVLGERFDAMPRVALRALDDNLPTAQWDRADATWHLAVPAVCGDQRIVGLSQRRGYTRRFTTHEVTALRLGLAG
jgi:hypothetical protein